MHGEKKIFYNIQLKINQCEYEWTIRELNDENKYEVYDEVNKLNYLIQLRNFDRLWGIKLMLSLTSEGSVDEGIFSVCTRLDF